MSEPDVQILESTVRVCTFTGLEAGRGYAIAISAENKYGWGRRVEKVLSTQST